MLGLDCSCGFLLKTTFMTIGGLFVLYYALALLRFLYSSFLKGSTLSTYKKEKSWAGLVFSHSLQPTLTKIYLSRYWCN